VLNSRILANPDARNNYIHVYHQELGIVPRIQVQFYLCGKRFTTLIYIFLIAEHPVEYGMSWCCSLLCPRRTNLFSVIT